MICPKFFVRQDNYIIVITIEAPNADIKDTEVIYFDKTFLFVSNPYFLRLLLPKEVVEDEFKVYNYNFNEGNILF